MTTAALRKPVVSARSSRTREHNGVVAVRETHCERIEMHVAGACLRLNGDRWQLLAGRRTGERSLFPSKWECGGGHVQPGEDLRAAVKRQIFEEFGLDIVPQYIIEDYSIHVPRGIIPGVRFLCIAKEGNVRLDPREFSEWRWLDIPIPADLDWIPGVKDVLDTALPAFLSSLVDNSSSRTPGFIR